MTIAKQFISQEIALFHLRDECLDSCVDVISTDSETLYKFEDDSILAITFCGDVFEFNNWHSAATQFKF